MKKINVAIVGCGAVAEIFHIPTLQRMPEFNISALVDVNEERAKQLKNEYGLNCETHSDYHKVFSNNTDAIFVLTPPKFHSQITIDAAEAGKHIFCEKPMEVSLDNAKKMIDAAQKANVKFMVGLNFRFIPQFRKIRDLVEKGFFGNLIGASSSFFANAFVWPSKTKFQYTKQGGGTLFEMGCHHVDLLRWYLGDVKSVFADIRTVNKDVAIDDTATVYINFDNGSVGHLATGWGELSINEIKIYGDGGFASVSGNKNEVLFTAKGFVAQSPIKISVDKNISPYHDEFRHFFECIIKDKDPITNGYEGYKTLETTLAAYEASEKRVPILVNK